MKILYRVGFVIALLAFLTLTACKGNNLQNNPVSSAESHEEYAYTKTVKEVKSAELSDILPFSYTFSDEYLYYCVEKYKADEDELRESYIIKRIPIEYEGEEENVITLDMRPLSFSAKSESDSEVISMIFESDNDYIIKEYNTGSKGETEISSLKKAGKKRPTMILKTDEGFVIGFGDKCSFIDSTGKTISSFSCPGNSFNQLITAGDKVVYATYSKGNKSYIGKFTEGSDKVAVETEIPSTTKNICFSNGTILTTDGKEIAQYNLEEGECSRLIELISYDLSLSDVNCFTGSADKISIFSKNPFRVDSKAKLIQLVRTDQLLSDRETDVDPLGRKIIRLYSSSEEARRIAISDEMILSFNESSNDYKIEIIDPKERGGFEDLEEGDVVPDVLLIYWGNYVEKYATKGYLADLWPLIDEYSNIDRSDIHKSVTESFERNDKLYAIPMFLSAYTIMIKESATDGKEGWTSMEFLDWLDEHKDVYVNFYAGKREILDCCVNGSLESYVDFTTGEVKFEESDFAQILEKIKGINLEHENEFVDTDPFISDAFDSRDKTILFISALSDLNTFARFEIMEDEEIINMGLPSPDRGRKALSQPIASFAVYEKSKCKEGAIEFIEFCLRHGNDTLLEYEIVPKGRAASLYSAQKEGFDALIGTHENYSHGMDYTVTADQAERFSMIFENAIPDTSTKEDIRSIIEEEAQIFFDGSATAEDTVSKIQARVSILVSERK